MTSSNVAGDLMTKAKGDGPLLYPLFASEEFSVVIANKRYNLRHDCENKRMFFFFEKILG